MRCSLRLLAIVAALALAAAPATAEPLPRPPGSQPADPGTGAMRSGRGFRDTVEFYKKLLARRGIAHDLVGPYRRRGVLVARFVARQGAPFAAIHVWLQGGRTYLNVVEASP